MLRSAVKKIWATVAHVQVLVVFFAFALMVLFSLYFMNNILRKQLIYNAQMVLDSVETRIKEELMEPRTLMSNISQTVRGMILEGGSAAAVSRYFNDVTGNILLDANRQLSGISGIYGFFDVFGSLDDGGGKFIDGIDRVLPKTIVYRECPWYGEAAAADGEIVLLQPCANMENTFVVITYAQGLFDHNGKLLGVIALDLKIEKIRDYIINANLGKTGYGFLLDKQYEFLIHGNPDLQGTKLEDLNNSDAKLAAELKQGHDVSEFRMINYEGVSSIAFIREIENGWYIGVVTPKDEYYREMRTIRLILSILGIALAFLLSIILLNIVKARNKADARKLIMFNAMPYSANIHNKNFECIDCNESAINLFELSGKREYLEKFYQLSPEYQPDGKLSREKIAEVIGKAFTDGYFCFEWMHQKLNGEPIPCEITLVRVEQGDEFALVAYLRDLRELKQRERLLNTVNSVANVLLSINDGKSFEVALLKSFELIGHCLDVDRVQIWRNEMIEGELHFVLRYAWFSEYDRNSDQVPIGLHFPYNVKPEWESLFLRGGNINSPLSGLKDAELSFLHLYGMKSIVIIPMFLEGNFWGLFSIDDCRVERTFSDEEMHMLSSVGLMMSTAVDRDIQTAKIREADERVRIMFDAMPLGASYHDKNMNCFECNQNMVNIFGLSNKQEYLEKFFQLSPEYQPDGSLTSKKMAEVAAKAFNDGSCSFEWMHKNLNGELIPCEVTLMCVKHNNEFIYVVYLRDLRELKATIEKVQESKQLLRLLQNILNGIDAMIYVTVPETDEILFVNDYMKEHFNIDDECVGQFCYNVFRTGTNERCGFCPCHQLEKDPDSIIVWEECNPLSGRTYRNTDRYIKWSDGRIVHIQHSVDVTELIAAREEAERSNRYKSQFLSRMSHEIRTPMNAILGITEIQLQDETLGRGIREALDRIYNSGYLLLNLINDILDLSKIEAGKLELVPVNYDVPSLINDTVHLNIMRFDSKPVKFKLHADESVPMTLFGDELRIKQILNNLLSNAFKYTDEGEVSMSVTAEYARQEDAPQVTLVFRITDTGQGMTRDQVDKLFDEYTRFNMYANRTTEGTGLGMSITKQLVSMMGGEISVESEPGNGSVFTVRLQQGIVDSRTLGRELAEKLKQFNVGKVAHMKKAPQILREYMPYGRVLIVDDVETNLYVAKGLMAPYGLSIDTAASGVMAIEKIKGGATYDIIFMDHFMPRMDGMEATKIIRDLGYKRPIIALTANTLAGQAEIFLENGFDGFISKPIDIRQLNDSLNKLIRDKYPPEVVEAARQQAAKFIKSANEDGQPSSDLELAAVFVKDAEKALALLKEIIANAFRRKNDFRQYVINVHSMKSALANIGETELSAVAAKLELAGRAENIKVIMDETPAFLEALGETIEKNRPKEDAGDTVQEDSDIEKAYLNEKLLVIRTACEKYDEAAAYTALTELRQKKWSKPVKNLLDTIAGHLLHSDFEEAAKLAENNE